MKWAVREGLRQTEIVPVSPHGLWSRQASVQPEGKLLGTIRNLVDIGKIVERRSRNRFKGSLSVSYEFMA
jgi:hypothetical protein